MRIASLGYGVGVSDLGAARKRSNPFRCGLRQLGCVEAHNDLEADGRLSCQGDFAALFRRSASPIDKILKGTQRGDIAFERSTQLDLRLNLTAAKAPGLNIPQSLWLRADEVIR